MFRSADPLQPPQRSWQLPRRLAAAWQRASLSETIVVLSVSRAGRVSELYFGSGGDSHGSCLLSVQFERLWSPSARVVVCWGRCDVLGFRLRLG